MAGCSTALALLVVFSTLAAEAAPLTLAAEAAPLTLAAEAAPLTSTQTEETRAIAAPQLIAQTGQESLDQAAVFIDELIQAGLGILNGANDNPATQRLLFSELFEQSFAMLEISRLVLGRAWTKADATEREQFRAVLGSYLAKQLIEGFPPGGEFQILAARRVDAPQRDDTLIEVKTIFSSADAQGEILWSVIASAGRLSVLDASFAGRSFLLTQRAAFLEILRQLDGSIPALIEEIAG